MSKRRFIFLKGRFVRIDRRFIFQIGILLFYLLACYTAKYYYQMAERHFVKDNQRFMLLVWRG